MQRTEVKVEQWDMFELALNGPMDGNPFLDTELSAAFVLGDKEVTVEGFYDGDGQYRVRFMPDQAGDWSYETWSNRNELDGVKGSFSCTPPSSGNRGPVRVSRGCHFSYGDGTPYIPVGTTSYGWAHQQPELASETLDSLKAGPFNKIRMCVLPHYSPFSEAHIPCFPFEGTAPLSWDYTRPNPIYFQLLESRVKALQELGIEADLILFHPYNKPWGFDRMEPETDEHLVRYTLSRLGAYRNVWWSLANEFDFIAAKSTEDWDRLGHLVHELDPYGKLCSIHNGFELYAGWQPWVTHACVQDGLAVTHPGRAVVLRNVYRKPVIYDEVCYEGNLQFLWGRLSAEELVSRFWRGIAEGTYVGHGEVLRPPGASVDNVWTGIGGTLRGGSAERIGFYRSVVESGPVEGMEPIDEWFRAGVAGKHGEYYLLYFGEERPERWRFELPGKDVVLPEGLSFHVDIIDTWGMSIERVDHTFEIVREEPYGYTDIYNRHVELPGKPYLALRVTVNTEAAASAAVKEESA